MQSQCKRCAKRIRIWGVGAFSLYHLIIADDERGSRELLCEYVKNSGLGFDVAGMFASGRAALDFMADNPVDAVLADIRMPGLDGLDLAQAVAQQYPNVRVALVSGYGQFDYARRAIQYGVVDYMMKPIRVKELYETLERLRARLTEQKRRENGRSGLAELRREQFFSELLAGGIASPEEMRSGFDALDFALDLTQTRLTAVRLVPQQPLSSEKTEQIRTGAPQLLRLLANAAWCGSVSGAGFGWVFVIVQDIAQAPPLRDAVESAFVSWLPPEAYRVEPVYAGAAADFPQPVLGRNLRDLFSLALSNLLAGDRDGAQALLRTLSNELHRSAAVPEERLTQSAEEMLALFRQTYCAGDALPAEPPAEPEVQAAELSQAAELAASDDAVICHAREYILSHYMCDLTRDEVAEAVFLNSSYFSRYFKQKTGESFYDYLNHLRIRQSLGLLNSTLRIEQVSELVGYHHVKYYRRHFKDYMGYTPMEYRRLVLHMQNAEAEDED